MVKNRVILAGNNGLFIDAIRAVIESDDAFEVVARCRAGVESVHLSRELRPDVIIADQHIPDINLLQMVREVQLASKKTKFLLIIRDENEELFKIIEETPNIGVLSNNSGVQEMLRALKLVAKGDNYIDPETITNLRRIKSFSDENGDRLSKVTQREKCVLYWLAHGKSNKEIAAVLILSEKTIKNHVSSILKKLGLQDRTKAAALAWEEGLPLASEEFFK